MRYQIVKDGTFKVLLTVTSTKDADKVLELMGEGYHIVPITKAEHTARFNMGRGQ